MIVSNLIVLIWYSFSEGQPLGVFNSRYHSHLSLTVTEKNNFRGSHPFHMLGEL